MVPAVADSPGGSSAEDAKEAIMSFLLIMIDGGEWTGMEVWLGGGPEVIKKGRSYAKEKKSNGGLRYKYKGGMCVLRRYQFVVFTMSWSAREHTLPIYYIPTFLPRCTYIYAAYPSAMVKFSYIATERKKKSTKNFEWSTEAIA